MAKEAADRTVPAIRDESPGSVDGVMLNHLPRLTSSGVNAPDVVMMPDVKDVKILKRMLNAMSGEACYCKDAIGKTIDPVCLAVTKSMKAVGDEGELTDSDRLFLFSSDGFVLQTTSPYAMDSMRRIVRLLGPPGKGAYKLKVAKVPNGDAIVLLVE